MTISTVRSRAEGFRNGNRDRDKTQVPRGQSVKGTEVRVGTHHHNGPHAGDMTRVPLGVPWAEKWPAIRIWRECCGADTPLASIECTFLYEAAEKPTDNRQHGRAFTARLMLIFRAMVRSLAPAHSTNPFGAGVPGWEL